MAVNAACPNIQRQMLKAIMSEIHKTKQYWGRSPGGRQGNPLQYSYLEILTGRGAQQASGHRAAKSQTRLSNLAHPPKAYVLSLCYCTCHYYFSLRCFPLFSFSYLMTDGFHFSRATSDDVSSLKSTLTSEEACLLVCCQWPQPTFTLASGCCLVNITQQ